MKKLLIIIGIVAALMLAYYLITSNTVRDLIGTLSNTELGSEKRETGVPSVEENGSYTIDTRVSTVSVRHTASTGTEMLDMDVRSGALMVEGGNISGGSILLATGGLKQLVGMNASIYPDATLAIKAVIFDQQQSTTENLVFRTDAELTMNGRTNPVSFTSDFEYTPGAYVINGSANPNWKLWDIDVPAGESLWLEISLRAAQ